LVLPLLGPQKPHVFLGQAHHPVIGTGWLLPSGFIRQVCHLLDAELRRLHGDPAAAFETFVTQIQYISSIFGCTKLDDPGLLPAAFHCCHPWNAKYRQVQGSHAILASEMEVASQGSCNSAHPESVLCPMEFHTFCRAVVVWTQVRDVLAPLLLESKDSCPAAAYPASVVHVSCCRL